MRKRLRWQWPREQTFWWPERQFLVKAKEYGQQWIACAAASSYGTNYLKESSDENVDSPFEGVQGGCPTA